MNWRTFGLVLLVVSLLKTQHVLYYTRFHNIVSKVGHHLAIFVECHVFYLVFRFYTLVRGAAPVGPVSQARTNIQILYENGIKRDRS